MCRTLNDHKTSGSRAGNVKFILELLITYIKGDTYN